MRDSFPLAVHFFPNRSFSRVVQRGVPQQPLQPRDLAQCLQPFGFRDSIPPNLTFVNAGIADAMFAAQIRDRDAGLVLLQNSMICSSGKAAALPLVLRGPERTLTWTKSVGQAQTGSLASDHCAAWRCRGGCGARDRS